MRNIFRPNYEDIEILNRFFLSDRSVTIGSINSTTVVGVIEELTRQSDLCPNLPLLVVIACDDATEDEARAVADAIRILRRRHEVWTLGVIVNGWSALVLRAGTHRHRYVMPSTIVTIPSCRPDWGFAHTPGTPEEDGMQFLSAQQLVSAKVVDFILGRVGVVTASDIVPPDR